VTSEERMNRASCVVLLISAQILVFASVDAGSLEQPWIAAGSGDSSSGSAASGGSACGQEICQFGAQCLTDPKTSSTGCFCKEMCPMIYAPVCGMDEVTYPNECELRSVECQQHRAIGVKDSGACAYAKGNPGNNYECPNHARSVNVDYNGVGGTFVDVDTDFMKRIGSCNRENTNCTAYTRVNMPCAGDWTYNIREVSCNNNATLSLRDHDHATFLQCNEEIRSTVRSSNPNYLDLIGADLIKTSIIKIEMDVCCEGPIVSTTSVAPAEPEDDDSFNDSDN